MPKNTRKNSVKNDSKNIEVSSNELSSNAWINELPGSSTKFDILSEKWFYMYPPASEARYKELRDNHPDLDPIAVSESICELILTEFVEEAVGDIVGYAKGDINGNDGINKSKFQVLCSKCKKYKAATKYGPHFHKCIGIDKAETAKDNKKNNKKLKLKIKLDETERDTKEERIPPMIILKKRSVSTDDDNAVCIPNAFHVPEQTPIGSHESSTNQIDNHNLTNYAKPQPEQAQNAEKKKIKSPKYELVTRIPEDSKEIKIKKIKNLKVNGKKSMFISFDNTVKKSSNNRQFLQNENKEENNVIVDKLIDSLDKMEIDEIQQSSQNCNIAKQPSDAGSDRDDNADANHNDKDDPKTTSNGPKEIPTEVLFALERLGISNEMTKELYHEQHNSHDDQDFIDKTFVDFENEILREYYHGNNTEDDESLDDEDDDEDYDEVKIVHRKDFPFEVYENISKILNVYSQNNIKFTMGDIVRIVGIVSKHYPLYVCQQIYKQLFSCLNQNGFFQKSNVEIEEIFDTVPKVVPRVFENYSNEQNHEEQDNNGNGETKKEDDVKYDLETLASLEETIPADFEAVCLDEFELDCIEDLLNNRATDDLLESSSLLNFIEINSSEDQLPTISQQDIEEFLMDAEQNVCNYLAVKNRVKSTDVTDDSDSDSEVSLSDESTSPSSTTSNSSEDYSTKATLNSSSVSSSSRSRTNSSSSTLSSSTTLSSSSESFNSCLSSSSSANNLRQTTKSNHLSGMNGIASSSSSSSFCSIRCEREQSDMSDVVKSLDEMSIEIGSSSENKGESSQSD